jgi:hypothetical protein
MAEKYTVYRKFARSNDRVVVDTGLSLKEVTTLLASNETCSATCKLPENQAITRKLGSWFDYYEQE